MSLPMEEVTDEDIEVDTYLVSDAFLYRKDTKEKIDNFRVSQFHYSEPEVIILSVLYMMVFVVGILGNTLALTWMRRNSMSRERRSTSSVFDPFLINMCIADHLVLFSCCPFMVYTKITSFWFLGSFSCTFVHYLQGVAVTSSTLSMASLSLIRFLLIRYPTSRENKSFYRKIRVILLMAIWFISLITSIPILFVRREETAIVATFQFHFCLENWKHEELKKYHSISIFSAMYALPSGVLLFCHLKIAHLIREYEKSLAFRGRTSSRNSFNRMGFRSKSCSEVQPSQSLYSHSVFDDGPLPSQQDDRALTPDCDRITPMPPRGNDQIINGVDQTIRSDGFTAVYSKVMLSTERKIQKMRNQSLNQKRKQVSQLIIWTAYCFVICWLPYNLLSLYLDHTPSEWGLKLLPFTLLLGHFHSAINPLVYCFTLKRNEAAKTSEMRLIEMRAQQLKQLNSIEQVDRDGHGHQGNRPKTPPNTIEGASVSRVSFQQIHGQRRREYL